MALFYLVRDAKTMAENYQSRQLVVVENNALTSTSPVTAAFNVLLDIFFSKSNEQEIYVFVTQCRALFYFSEHFSLKESKQFIYVKVCKFIKDSNKRQDLVYFSITHVSDIIMQMYNWIV